MPVCHAAGHGGWGQGSPWRGSVLAIDAHQTLSVLARGLCAFAAEAPEFELHSVPGATLALTGLPLAEANYALVYGGDAPEDTLRSYIARIHERGLPAEVLAAHDVRARLAQVAQSAGLAEVGVFPAMVHDGPIRPEGSDVFHVDRLRPSDPRVAAVAHMIDRTFGLPPAVLTPLISASVNRQITELWLAERGGVPVSSVWVCPQGDSASVWTMATDPALQRQGAGRVLLSQVMARMRERGISSFALWASPAGRPLYDRLGYRAVTDLHSFATGHSVDASDTHAPILG